MEISGLGRISISRSWRDTVSPSGSVSPLHHLREVVQHFSASFLSSYNGLTLLSLLFCLSSEILLGLLPGSCLKEIVNFNR